MITGNVGPYPGASQTVGGSTLPSSPTFRQIFMKSGSSAGLYACSANGVWTGPFSTGGGITGLTAGTIPQAASSTTLSDSVITQASSMIGIGLGATVPPTVLTAGDTSSSTPRGVMSWQASADASSAHLHMRKTRGTFAAPGAVLTADVLGRVVFSGYDSASYLETAYIRALATGTVAATRIPSKLEFWTSTDAAPSVATLALTLGADQSAAFAGQVAVAQGTLSGSSAPFINHTATWSNAGTTFVNILSNVTNTNSGANSLLMDLQVGSTSQFKVSRGGNVTIPAGAAFIFNGQAGITSPNANQIALRNSAFTAPAALLASRVVTTKTADYIVLSSDTNAFFDNTGASGTVNFTLPTAAAGLTCEFYRDANQTVQVTAGASTTIRVGTSVSTSGGNVTLDAVGSKIRLVAISTTQWVGDLTGAATFA